MKPRRRLSVKPSTSSQRLQVIDLGLRPYREAWDYQKQVHAQRVAGETPDTLIFTQHPPVYTLGNRADPADITATQEFLSGNGIEVVKSDRGGLVTYHGPGQLVGYPIIDLNSHRPSISWYMDSLQEAIILALADFGIQAHKMGGLTGVWVGDAKIAALGVRVARWVTMHGFAVNVDTDSRHFAGIIPCGIRDKGVTSMAQVLGRQVDMEGFKQSVTRAMQSVFNFDKSVFLCGPQPAVLSR